MKNLNWGKETFLEKKITFTSIIKLFPYKTKALGMLVELAGLKLINCSVQYLDKV